MADDYKLNINISEFYKSASLAELKEAHEKYREAMNTAQAKMRELQQMIHDLILKDAEEKFDGIKEGDKVSLTVQDYGWLGKKRESFEIKGHFFGGLSIRALESVYMNEGPYLNLHVPKKDGTIGKRYRSVKVERILEIKKED